MMLRRGLIGGLAAILAPDVLAQPSASLLTRTNLVLWSADLTNAAWNKGGCSVTPNATAAPNGTATAGLVVEAAGAGAHGVSQLLAKAASALTYTFSIYAKAGTRSVVRVMMEGSASGSAYAHFDLSSGVAAAPVLAGGWTAASATQTAVGNGWYRCLLTATSNADAGVFVDAYLINAGASSYTGDGTSGLYVWGAQLETAAYDSPYFATTSVPVTRGPGVSSRLLNPTGANQGGPL